LQVILVKTSDWHAFQASIQFYERKRGDAPWEAFCDNIPAVIGKKGLGWGRGLHPPDSCVGSIKREGDGKSPAGMFLLGTAFGYAPPDEVAWIRLPYRQATDCLQCVDDPHSPYYNELVDTTEVKQVWKTHEEMRRQDGLYRLGVVVKHNADTPVAGLGSCIFLHIWKGPHEGTSGCTAMGEERMEWLLRRLDPSANPVIVQLPEMEYGRFRAAWNLP